MSGIGKQNYVRINDKHHFCSCCKNENTTNNYGLKALKTILLNCSLSMKCNCSDMKKIRSGGHNECKPQWQEVQIGRQNKRNMASPLIRY